MARIMITNGGAHPPEKWAMVTAERIFDIGGTVAGARLIRAQKLQLAIAEALMPHHEKIQSTERRKLDEDIKNMLTPTDPTDYLDSIMNDIVKVSKGTPWQDHFQRPEVQEAARRIITNDIATVQHVERSWHADHHPDSAESKTYHEMFRGV